MIHRLLIILFIISLLRSSYQGDNDILKVHLVPHTHDDVGWVNTFDSYYTGKNQNIYVIAVKLILDSVIRELQKDPLRKFIYVEMAFFHRYWNEIDEKQKKIIKKLVKNGQLEFVNAGWVMHDEATPYYEDMIDQMSLGHQFILKNFDVTPTTGWQIDPFGHSATNAILFGKMQFDNEYFWRIDYQDRNQREASGTMEFIQEPYQLNNIQRIFTSINLYEYQAPPGFCFDYHCPDNPIYDNSSQPNYNLKQKADQFVNYFKSATRYYPSHQNVVMHVIGHDFHWGKAERNFAAYDKLINYINQRKDTYKVEMLYSTPSQYYNEIKDRVKDQLQIKRDDFFPYAGLFDEYWTGFFSSRPSLKYLVKSTGRYLQSMRTQLQLVRLNNLSNYQLNNNMIIENNLYVLEQAQAIAQHHDAVSGTEKLQVANDYRSLIYDGLNKFNDQYFKVLYEINQKAIGENITQYSIYDWQEAAEDWKSIYDNLKQGSPVLLTIYNPQYDKVQILRIKVPRVNISILDQNNKKVEDFDIVCLNKTNEDNCDLYIEKNLKQFEISYLKIHPNGQIPQIVQQQQLNSNQTIDIYGQQILVVQKNNKVYFSDNDDLINFGISYNHYTSNSGAYLFKPNGASASRAIPYANFNQLSVYYGKIVTIVKITFDKAISQIKLYKNKNFKKGALEIESFLDSIDTSNYVAKEVTLNIDTNVNNDRTFYTDSNGLLYQKRILNYRATWNVQISQQIAGNYYPITAGIFINDTNKKVSLLTDRAQGGSSYLGGNIEVMLNRRLVSDDNKGVQEVLNELDYDGQGLRVRYRHYLHFSKNTQINTDIRQIQYEMDTEPVVFISKTENREFSNNSNSISLNNHFDVYQPLTKIYLEQLKSNRNQIQLRVHNLDEVDEKYLQIPKSFKITQLSLSANQKINQSNIDYSNKNFIQLYIQPMDIQTFSFVYSDPFQNNNLNYNILNKESPLEDDKVANIPINQEDNTIVMQINITNSTGSNDSNDTNITLNKQNGTVNSNRLFVSIVFFISIVINLLLF